MLVTSPVSLIKYSHKSNLREKVFILAGSSRIQSILAGKSQQLELEVAGFIAIVNRKQRAFFLFLLILSRTPAQGMVLPTVKMGLLTSLNLI